MKKIWQIANGWKVVLAWVLMNVPNLTDYPMLKASIEALLQDANWHNIVKFAIQVLLTVGVGHRVLKNLNGE